VRYLGLTSLRRLSIILDQVTALQKKEELLISGQMSYFWFMAAVNINKQNQHKGDTFLCKQNELVTILSLLKFSDHVLNNWSDVLNKIFRLDLAISGFRG